MKARLNPGDICVPYAMKNTILIAIAPMDRDDVDVVLWMCLSNYGDVQWWYEESVMKI